MRTCPAADCFVEIPDAIFMCRAHWFQVPYQMRGIIHKSFRDYTSGKITIEELRAIQQPVIDAVNARNLTKEQHGRTSS
jgi:hypothetical protein